MAFTRFLYPSTAFFGSFLLFAIQPIAAKAFLPHFGGSAAVWSVSILFFMTLLLGGYWYAHLLLRLPFILQRVIHGGLLAASVLFVARVFFSGNTLISPSLVGGESNFASPVWELLAALLISGAAWSGWGMFGPTGEAVVHTVTFFLLCVVCHGELYRRRPSASFLTSFYGVMALGSTLGALFVNFLAPAIFRSGLWEFPLGLFFAFVVALALLKSFWREFLSPRAYYAAVLTLSCFFLLTLSWRAITLTRSAVAALRNFYGPLVVLKGHSGADAFYKLLNGATIHGLQYRNGPLSYSPASYYSETSGAGLAFLHHPRKEQGRSLRVGVVGLGAGTLAAYCREGDSFLFYEINPAVVEIAKTQFDYVKRCPDARIVEGDGRIVLARELREKGSRRFNLLVVDAFSDDAIPVHLFTKEAMELYFAHLDGPDGILALHVSNRYLNLVPIAMRLADHLGLAPIVVESSADEARGIYKAVWVLMAREARVFDHRMFRAAALPVRSSVSVPLWTDHYSNILAALRWF